MADAATVETDIEPKSSKMPLILGFVFLLLGGGGGFYASWSGLILNNESPEPKAAEVKKDAAPKITFVPIEPITISLPQSSEQKHLIFRAELEVAHDYAAEVEEVLPRVIDVLNSYLRAIEVSDIQNPSALTRLRAQMLRRVQVVAGPGRVNDLLIMEFVLN